MKTNETRRTNRVGNMVAYPSPYGQRYHTYVVPRDLKTPAQSRMRSIFGSSSKSPALKLTELQRQHSDLAAPTVASQPSLGHYAHLSGQQLCIKISSTLRCIGLPPVEEPPQPVDSSPNLVGELAIDYDGDGTVRLRLAVGEALEDLMLFGEAPRSALRMKHLPRCCLGPLGPASDGRCGINALCAARFGEPLPDQKVLVATRQHRNGLKSLAQATSAIVPPRPLDSGAQTTKASRTAGRNRHLSGRFRPPPEAVLRYL